MDQFSDTPRPIRLGLIGTGLAVEKLHWPVLSRTPRRYSVVAFADRSREQAERFSSYSGIGMEAYHADYQDLLGREDVEAVLICLPIALLYTACRESLEAGKDVVCEKPVGRDEAEGRAFLELPARFPERTVLIGENFFYRDAARLARWLLDEGAVGRLHLMAWRAVSRNVPRPGQFSSTPWRQHPEYRGGAHLDAGVHDVAEIRLCCGDVASLHGLTQGANSTIDGAPADLILNLQFVSGAIGSYTAAYPDIAVPREPREMRLYGTEGTMIVSGGREHRRVTVQRGDEVEVHSLKGVDDGYLGELCNFYDAVIHGDPVVGTIGQSFENQLIVQRALDSAESGHVVPVGGGDASGQAGVPLWRPRGAEGLFDGLPGTHSIERADARSLGLATR
ncbi:MAG TPA: Gfo/Idh/MocA family oxidoreductase [Candidatus Dormibacteraeota bacterium]|nr:Gfo/Idh/MocA family oxidoreductase [Candidatus Dormibacteraeota bacterium]